MGKQAAVFSAGSGNPAAFSATSGAGPGAASASTGAATACSFFLAVIMASGKTIFRTERRIIKKGRKIDGLLYDKR